MHKKLFRPKKGRVLFGVATGLGEYFDIDPVVFRILFVIMTIWGGAGILLYIIGIILIPDEKSDSIKEEFEDIKKEHSKNDEVAAEEVKVSKNNNNDSNMIFGLLVIMVGLMFLFANFFPWFSWIKLWPIILIFFGLLIIGDTFKDKI